MEGKRGKRFAWTLKQRDEKLLQEQEKGRWLLKRKREVEAEERAKRWKEVASA